MLNIWHTFCHVIWQKAQKTQFFDLFNGNVVSHTKPQCLGLSLLSLHLHSCAKIKSPFRSEWLTYSLILRSGRFRLLNTATQKPLRLTCGVFLLSVSRQATFSGLFQSVLLKGFSLENMDRIHHPKMNHKMLVIAQSLVVLPGFVLFSFPWLEHSFQQNADEPGENDTLTLQNWDPDMAFLWNLKQEKHHTVTSRLIPKSNTEWLSFK